MKDVREVLAKVLVDLWFEEDGAHERISDQNMKPYAEEAQDLIVRLKAANLEIGPGWNTDMSEALEHKHSPLFGFANGVPFLMKWSVGSARLNEAFKAAFKDPKPVQSHEPGWYAWAAGLSCYSGSGEKIKVYPTAWKPIIQPCEVK